jgi:hypothetical protein
MKTFIIALSVALSSYVSSSAVHAELTNKSPDAIQVVQHAWQLFRQHAVAEQEDITLTMVRAQEASTVKQLTRWTRFATSGEQVVLKFNQPQADAGLGLWLDRSDRAAQQIWLRMPSWIKARRVSGERQQQYFAGTDLTFEDNAQLSGEDTQAYTYRLLDETKQGFWIEAKPKAGVVTGYSRREIWIDRDFAISRIDYFDQAGQLLKSMENKKLQKFPKGGWRPNQVVIENFQEQRRTQIDIQQRHFDGSVASHIFSEGFLED